MFIISRIFLSQVSMNGYFSLDEKFTKKTPRAEKFPPSVSLIAPFWADLDTSVGNGSLTMQIIDRQTANNVSLDVLRSVQEDVRTYKNHSKFIASWVAIVTWEAVSPFPAKTYWSSEV